MWVEAKGLIKNVNSVERYNDYESQFFKGLLDADMRAHAVCMDPDYTHDQLRFARPQRGDEQASISAC